MQVITGEDDATVVAVTTILEHSPLSTSPAFFVTLQEEVPPILLVQFPYYLQIGDRSFLVNESVTSNKPLVLTVEIEVLAIGEVMNLTYFSLLDGESRVEGNISKPVLVNYTTIKQEGIGLMVFVGGEGGKGGGCLCGYAEKCTWEQAQGLTCLTSSLIPLCSTRVYSLGLTWRLMQ